MEPQATQQRQQLLTAGSALDNVLTQMNQRLDALEQVAASNSAGIQQISLTIQTMNANLERALANMQNTEEQLGRVRRSWNYKVEQPRTAGRSSVVDSVIEQYRVSKGW
jgi:chromosome segregation ATPase